MVSVAILAGGESRRFGSDKTLFLFKGKPLIEWVVNSARKYNYSDILVVAKDLNKYSFLNDVRLINDISTIQCSLIGLISAFDGAENDKVFVISADMPFFDFSLVEKMEKMLDKEDVDAVIPYVDGKFYPLAALYKKKCSYVFNELIRTGEYRVMEAIKQLNYSVIKKDLPDKVTFTNINTKEEYDSILKHI